MASNDPSVLVVAPIGRDSELAIGVLQGAGIASESFPDVEALLRVPLESTAAILITEEALLDSESVANLASVLLQQPAWSDIPIILLSAGGIETATSRTWESVRAPILVTTVLERPIRISTLVSTVRGAIGIRLRQYTMRDSLEEQRRIELEADQAIRQSEAKLSQMADAMPQIVWTARPDGAIEYFNHRWYEFTGLERRVNENLHWTSAVHPDELPSVQRNWHLAISNGKNYHCEFRLWDQVRKTWRWHLSRAVPGRDSSGEIVRWYGSTTDIDDIKQAEEGQLQTQKLESIGVLAGGIAHDFNNLLTGIIGNVSLASEILSADQPAQELLQEVVKCSERAAVLIAQLLAYAGKRNSVLAPVSLTTLVRENIALLQGSIPKNVELRLDLALDLPKIQADIGQMQQIVMNLIINAAEAVGNIPGRVSVRTLVQTTGNENTPGPQVCLEVRDTGCGMDAATMARIFDPFFTTKFTGRGLGLSAVVGIIRAHKGTIDVQSSPGNGSVFQVLFPIADSAQLEEVAAITEKRIRTGSGTVLVVDDEEVIRTMAKAVLNRNGYEVHCAANGQEALETLERKPESYSAVILDLTMPVMTGEQVLPLIRTLAPKAAIVISSGFDETEIAPRFQERGVSGFLQKPYTAKVLAQKLADVLHDPIS